MKYEDNLQRYDFQLKILICRLLEDNNLLKVVTSPVFNSNHKIPHLLLLPEAPQLAGDHFPLHHVTVLSRMEELTAS